MGELLVVAALEREVLVVEVLGDADLVAVEAFVHPVAVEVGQLAAVEEEVLQPAVVEGLLEVAVVVLPLVVEEASQLVVVVV